MRYLFILLCTTLLCAEELAIPQNFQGSSNYSTNDVVLNDGKVFWEFQATWPQADSFIGIAVAIGDSITESLLLDEGHSPWFEVYDAFTLNMTGMDQKLYAAGDTLNAEKIRNREPVPMSCKAIYQSGEQQLYSASTETVLIECNMMGATSVVQSQSATAKRYNPQLSSERFSFTASTPVQRIRVRNTRGQLIAETTQHYLSTADFAQGTYIAEVTFMNGIQKALYPFCITR